MPCISAPSQLPTDGPTSPVRSQRDGGQYVATRFFNRYFPTIRHPHDEAALFIRSASRTVQVSQSHGYRRYSCDEAVDRVLYAAFHVLSVAVVQTEVLAANL